MTPARKAAHEKVLADVAAAAKKLADLDRKRDQVAAERDRLILRARTATPRPSLRDVAEIAGVSHAWVRKLEERGR